MSSSKKIFRDPIYDLIVFDKKKDRILLDIIDSPEFQRLRRIRQLGLSCYTYTSAVHDRFSHSIGVCYLVGQLIDHLKFSESSFNIYDEIKGTHVPIDTETLKLLLQITALLHDIGHGPFSHAFEKITNIKHEIITKKIIRDKESNINRLLKKQENKILSEYSIKWIIDILEEDFKPRWIKELISSQFDADRMDYLMRDAYMCGVNYTHFDWKWIFQNIQIIKTEDGEDEMLVIDGKKGIYSLESFIISRYHMYEQVYFHKTTRGFEVIVQKIFHRVKSLIEKGILTKKDFISKDLFDFIEISAKGKEPSLKTFLQLDDFILYSQFRFWMENKKDKYLPELCKCIVFRIPFKMVYEDDVGKFWKKGVDSEFRKGLTDDIYDNYFLIDEYENIPYKDMYLQGKDEKEQIRLLQKDGKTIELGESSEILKGIRNKKYQIERIYCHPEYKNKVNDIINLINHENH